MTKLSGKLRAAEAGWKEARSVLATREKAIDQLRRRNWALEAERDAALAKIGKLDKQLHEERRETYRLQKQHELAREQLGACQAERDALQGNFNYANQDRSDAWGRADDLQTQLGECQEERDKLSADRRLTASAGEIKRRTENPMLIDLDPALVARVQGALIAINNDSDATTHGTMDVQALVTLLLEDVVCAVERPGSWEGATMADVLRAHGYLRR